MDKGIIYKGPSLLDGQPIVVIGTYSNRNTKTGAVLQTYILCDNGLDPLEASKTGADYSICGPCVMRGTPTDDPNRKQAKDRDCYVNLGQGVLIVYRAYLKDIYPTAEPRALGRNRFVRVGTYGDPSAAPQQVWEELLSEASDWTAYSHQSGWRPDIAMQSVNSHTEAQLHWRQGHRTFRVIANLGQLDPTNEALCPASKEAGRRVQCTACKLCKGSTRAKSIAIVEH
jgi:hypothetical protein